MKNLISACLMSAIALPAFADLSVHFDEGAPKDRFSLRNDGTCPLGAATVTLDLGTSSAGLIFDVTARGAGVSVFQPLEVVDGQMFIDRISEVRDGDSSLVITLKGLAAGGRVDFTIDVDDTAGTRVTIVSGSEIEGARVILTQGSLQREALFGSDARASLTLDACTS